MGDHERQRVERDRQATQLLVPPEALEGLPTATIHDEQRHTLHHSNGIALVAERSIPTDTYVATEPANFTDGKDYPILEIYGNTKLVFKVLIPVSELSKGKLAVLARRGGSPIQRAVTGFGDSVEEVPIAVLGPGDSPITNPEEGTVIETMIHEHRSQTHDPHGQVATTRSPFEYQYHLGEERVEEQWQILLCRESGDVQGELTPEHLFRFGVSS